MPIIPAPRTGGDTASQVSVQFAGRTYTARNLTTRQREWLTEATDTALRRIGLEPDHTAHAA